MERKKVLSNLLWRFLERCGAQGVTFIVSIVLARRLDPNVYGLIALVTVFTSIVQVFVDGGLGNALVQKKNADELDFSSVFYFNVLMCLVVYGIMFATAPLIARFYNILELTPIIRVLSIMILISGVKNIQQAYVAKHLQYKLFFFATLAGTIGAAIVGIWMAYTGYGVWALVAQMLVNAAIDTIVLWIVVRWRPKRMFSFSRLKGLFSYGWKLLVSSLIDAIYNDLTQLIIGKLYSSEDLAFYNQGKKYPNVFVSNINIAIDSVLLPVMSNEQDDRKRIKTMMRRSIRISLFIMAPIMIGIAACGPQLIRLLITQKWMPALPYLRLFCVVYMLYPLQTANLNAIKALGRSDIYLILEVAKKCIGILILIITMHKGVMFMALGVMVTRVTYQFINMLPNQSLLGYSMREQLLDLFPPLITAGAMGALVLLADLLNLRDFPTLVLKVLIGLVGYFVVSMLLQGGNLKYAIEIAKGFLSKGTIKQNQQDVSANE